MHQFRALKDLLNVFLVEQLILPAEIPSYVGSTDFRVLTDLGILDKVDQYSVAARPCMETSICSSRECMLVSDLQQIVHVVSVFGLELFNDTTEWTLHNRRQLHKTIPRNYDLTDYWICIKHKAQTLVVLFELHHGITELINGV